MRINEIEFETEWTSDCQGKQDFDFNVLTVSTRYWPDNTAKPAIYLGEKVLVKPEEYICGETETECKYKTEQWIKENLSKLLEKILD